MGIISDNLARVVASPAFRVELATLPTLAPDFPDRLAWVNDSHDNELDDYPGPGWDGDRYEPTPEDEAEDLGRRLGREGELDVELSDRELLPWEVRLAFVEGLMEGSREYGAHLDALHAERMEDAFGEPDRHEAEVVEAIGCVEARRMNREG